MAFSRLIVDAADCVEQEMSILPFQWIEPIVSPVDCGAFTIIAFALYCNA